jgi:hypothetical protein
MQASRNVVHVDLFGGRVQAHYADGHAWVRLGGYGGSIKDARGRDLLFSDRNLHGAAVRVGPFILRALAPARRMQPSGAPR